MIRKENRRMKKAQRQALRKSVQRIPDNLNEVPVVKVLGGYATLITKQVVKV